MTTHDRDKIIAAAKEAGMYIGSSEDPKVALWWYPEIERLFDLAFDAGRQAEREECAKVCESTYPEYGGANPYCFETPSECAEAIRARSTK